MRDGKLEGRSALITGGSSGIGAAIAALFARNGATVCVCHHPDHDADALVSHLAAQGMAIHATGCDVADEASVARLKDWAGAAVGSIDVLVNCAGIGGDTPFMDLAVAEWDRMIAVHLRGTFLVTRAFFAGMVSRRYGRIINISSQLAYKGASGAVPYCAAKAGIVGFTRALSYEGAPHGVLVNSIAPGPVETDLLASFSDDWRRTKQAQLPLGRFGKVDEIAPTALMLASEDGSYYVGQTLSPNGGDVML